MSTEDFLDQGDLTNALQSLQEQVREDPANPKLRIFLFQLLAVTGQWSRALVQLNVAGEIDAGPLDIVCMYRQIVSCEMLREKIFQGKSTPMVFGQPEQWVNYLIQALQLFSQGEIKQAAEMRTQALDMVTAVHGSIDNQSFSWINDADSRLGPVLETIIEGHYMWVPFQQIRSIDIEPPEDLRDIVWLPAHFTWSSGEECYGLIPSRYPESHLCGDPLTALSRKTVWRDRGAGTYTGCGQRMLATDQNKFSLMNIRRIDIGTD